MQNTTVIGMRRRWWYPKGWNAYA